MPLARLRGGMGSGGAWGQTEFQVNLKLGLTPRRRTPRRRPLARLIARATEARLIALSAVLSGVKEVRAAIDEAAKVRRRGGRVILFIDEIHRFNKAQQDALLHAVE